MKKYLTGIEPAETGHSAYSPDLPGCLSTGAGRDEVEWNMHEAIVSHLDGLCEEGQPVPQPHTIPSTSNCLPKMTTIEATTTLYRPVGPLELQLIVESDYAAFPACLPDQPIF